MKNLLKKWRLRKYRTQMVKETLHDVKLSGGELSEGHLKDLELWRKGKITTKELLFLTRERHFRNTGVTL